MYSVLVNSFLLFFLISAQFGLVGFWVFSHASELISIRNKLFLFKYIIKKNYRNKLYQRYLRFIANYRIHKLFRMNIQCESGERNKYEL